MHQPLLDIFVDLDWTRGLEEEGLVVTLVGKHMGSFIGRNRYPRTSSLMGCRCTMFEFMAMRMDTEGALNTASVMGIYRDTIVFGFEVPRPGRTVRTGSR